MTLVPIASEPERNAIGPPKTAAAVSKTLASGFAAI
jgi:hypothetical protein